MRVAYFTESLYPLVDGVSRTLARLFATLENREIDFRVFSPFVPGPEVTWRDRVQAVPFVRFPPYPDYRISLPRISRFRAQLEASNLDLIHVVSPTPMAYRAQALGRTLGVPVVASFHTHFVSYFRYYGIARLEPLGWALLRRFYRSCARVYAPTQTIIEELRENGIQGVELWSRGIDLSAFSPEHRNDDLLRDDPDSEPRPMLLLVSRLVREKDLAELVDVNRILLARGVRFRLAIVGDGPMRRELEERLPDAHFAGHCTGHELARWYASADVFVFPSTTETLGNVVLEALASGLPSVVVDRGGPRDLIQPGRNGFIARSNDPESLADALQPLLSDAALREKLAKGARESALSRDWDSINDGLLRSYTQVAAETRRAGMGRG